MAIRRDVAIPNVVARIVNQLVLLARMVADVPIAKVRHAGTHEMQLEKMQVRQAVSYVGNRLADLQEMPQTEDSHGLRRSAVLIRGTLMLSQSPPSDFPFRLILPATWDQHFVRGVTEDD